MRNLFLILAVLSLSLQKSYTQKNYEIESRKVDSIIESYYQKHKPGIAVAAIKDGKTVYENMIGMADLEHQISITDSTAFHIASVSKQFTAYLALLLEKEGKLSMNDDIKNYLPELKELPYKIDLYQLANHTHGLPNLFELAHLKGKGPQNRMTHEEVIEMLLNIKSVNFKPGEKYEYNNTGFALLAEIIERVEGISFQEVLSNKVFEPVGMINSLAVNSPDLIIKNKAHSYKLENETYYNYDFNLMANGSSGISTTIDDLSKWAAFFQNPSVQAGEILKKMQAPTVLNSGDSIQYGLGLEQKNYKGVNLVFHGGGDAGYRSYILHAPENNFSVVILGNNNDFTPLEITYSIVDLFLKAHIKEPSNPKQVNYTTEELKAFEGTYQMFPGTYFNFIAERDTLYFQSYGSTNKAPLPVIGNSEFSFPYIPFSKFDFNENSLIFHIADFKYPAERIQLNKVDRKSVKYDDYTGIFRNEEFDSTFELVIENKKLVAKHSLNEDIEIKPLSKDKFYSKKSFFGELDFIRNHRGDILGFKLSGQNIKNIEFMKIGDHST